MRGRGLRCTLGAAAVALGIALGSAAVAASYSALVAGLYQVTPRAAAGSATRAVAPPHGTALVTYADYARNATVTLERTWLTGDAWRMCLLSGCPITNQDWGADAFTYSL